jgi:hypothetical protein
MEEGSWNTRRVQVPQFRQGLVNGLTRQRHHVNLGWSQGLYGCSFEGPQRNGPYNCLLKTQVYANSKRAGFDRGGCCRLQAEPPSLVKGATALNANKTYRAPVALAA